MNAFLISVAVLAGSTSMGLSALEGGDHRGALIRFALAGIAALGTARFFMRGVFGPRVKRPDSLGFSARP